MIDKYVIAPIWHRLRSNDVVIVPMSGENIWSEWVWEDASDSYGPGDWYHATGLGLGLDFSSGYGGRDVGDPLLTTLEAECGATVYVVNFITTERREPDMDDREQGVGWTPLAYGRLSKAFDLIAKEKEADLVRAVRIPDLTHDMWALTDTGHSAVGQLRPALLEVLCNSPLDLALYDCNAR